MSGPEGRTVTSLLRAWTGGETAALDQLIPIVDGELRKLARIYMSRERKDHTLQPTALVNEVFVRLIDDANVGWNDRAHFFGICARLMRRVLVDHARARGYQKRGGGVQRVPLDEQTLAAPVTDTDVIDLDAALNALALVDERKMRVVEMRYFGGLTVEQTADALGVSTDTVKRDWRLAKLWLVKHLEGNQGA